LPCSTAATALATTSPSAPRPSAPTFLPSGAWWQPLVVPLTLSPSLARNDVATRPASYWQVNDFARRVTSDHKARLAETAARGLRRRPTSNPWGTGAPPKSANRQDL
jgi:hypothetical protein